MRLPTVGAAASGGGIGGGGGGGGFQSGVEHEQPDAVGAEALSRSSHTIAEEDQLLLAAAGARFHRPKKTERRGDGSFLAAIAVAAGTDAIATPPRTVQQREDEARTRGNSRGERAYSPSVPLREALWRYLLVECLSKSGGAGRGEAGPRGEAQQQQLGDE